MISTIATNEKKGILLAILSGLLFGSLGFFGMSLMKSGLSVFELTFWRFFVATIFMGLLISLRHIKTKPTAIKNHPKHLLYSALVGIFFYTTPGILFFFSSKLIGTGQAMVIFFVYPAFVMLLNWIFNKKIITAHYWWSFAVILTGLIFLIDLNEFSFDVLGISMGLFAALSFAIFVFFSHKINLSASTSTFMVSLGCSIAAITLVLFEQPLPLPSQAIQWTWILGIGIFSSALPSLLLLKAIDYIPTDKASLLSVLEPIFTVIFGVILLDESMSLKNALGIVFILVGAMSISLKKNT